MRIFVPMGSSDWTQLRASSRNVTLEAGRVAWALTREARADRPTADPEDLEYDALQDAVFYALTSLANENENSRVAVMAVEVPESAASAATDLGAYGITLHEGHGRLASIHVTELGRHDAEASDEDPALLWFDPSEIATAEAYACGEDVDLSLS